MTMLWPACIGIVIGVYQKLLSAVFASEWGSFGIDKGVWMPLALGLMIKLNSTEFAADRLAECGTMHVAGNPAQGAAL